MNAFIFDRILFITLPCIKITLTGCNKSLGARNGGLLNASSFSASSSHKEFLPFHGRLSSGSVWMPKFLHNASAGNFLQVDLEELKIVTAVETEGKGTCYVTSFQVWHSKDGKTFSVYQSGQIKVNFC